MSRYVVQWRLRGNQSACKNVYRLQCPQRVKAARHVHMAMPRVPPQAPSAMLQMPEAVSRVHTPDGFIAFFLACMIRFPRKARSRSVPPPFLR